MGLTSKRIEDRKTEDARRSRDDEAESEKKKINKHW